VMLFFVVKLYLLQKRCHLEIEDANMPGKMQISKDYQLY
jgi:hypothetical protein